ncbi:MAG: hypothetical protein J0I06_11490, partial [Planctomycetes bacterium]|nr:hypothetical protein [Planctomycetota bacterium]
MPLRLLGAVAFAAVGFVVVWQGFGAAGYGTDAHVKRVCWACFQLLFFGLMVVGLRARLVVRVLVALVGLGSASWAWWTVRSSDFKSAMSLREAVESRDRYRERLAAATVGDGERAEGLRGINSLTDQYPSLSAELATEYDRWEAGVEDDIVARFARAPLDDLKTVTTLRRSAEALARVRQRSAGRLEAAAREWLGRAVEARAAELSDGLKGRDLFDRTAPARKALADAFPETRPQLVAAEEGWVGDPAGRLRSIRVYLEPSDRANWSAIEKNILSLNSLDTSAGRFKGARRSLFEAAHEDARSDVAAHLEAGRYDRAFGVARKHAVEWNATAAVLGPDEVRKLDALASIAALALPPRKPGRVTVIAADNGLDVAIVGGAKPDRRMLEALGRFGADPAFARLTVDGSEIFQARRPEIAVDGAALYPTAGGFLQAAAPAEKAMAEATLAHVGDARPVADLFSGIGTFTLRLARRAPVTAVEGEATLLAALDMGVRHAKGLKPVTTRKR